MDVTGRNGNIKISCYRAMKNREILFREEVKIYEIDHSNSLLQ